MRRSTFGLLGASLGLSVFLGSCSAKETILFFPLRLSFEQATSRSDEGQAATSIRLLLSAPSEREVRATVLYQDESASGRDDCARRDYVGEAETVVFAPGETTKTLLIRHLDDDVPESDEQVRLEIQSLTGAAMAEPVHHHHTIVDDDRGALFDVASDFGAQGDGSVDDTEALQNAIDRARLSDGAVVFFPPGTYQVRHLDLAAGVTYAGYQAVLQLAASQPENARLVSLAHSAEEDSPLTFLSGLTFDGNREQQGKFDDWEYQRSSLLFVEGDAARRGRAKLALESIVFQNAGGSGVVLGTNTDVSACDVHAREVFTDALKLSGGASRLALTHFSGAGEVGTTGIAITGKDPGFEQSQAVDVNLRSLHLASGDLEIDVQGGAQVIAQNVTMDSPPFFLRAVRSTVLIEESQIVMGVPEFRANRMIAPGDVVFQDCDLIVSESIEPGRPLPEEDRQLTFALVTWDDFSYGFSEDEEDVLVEVLSDQRLLFDSCRFQLGEDVEASDRTYVAGTATELVDPSQQLVLRNCTFDEGFDDIFSPNCGPCLSE